MSGEDETPEEVPEDTSEEVSEAPSVSSDPDELVENAIPEEIRKKFRIASYRKAASILKYGLQDEFSEILEALEAFEITTEMIRKPGGNESEIPKTISALLRHKGWNETTISGDLHITRSWREARVNKKGKLVTDPISEVYVREKFLDGHKSIT